MEIAITGYQMVVGLGIVGLSVAATIIALRYYFNQRLDTQSEGTWASRTKYAAYDVFTHSGAFFRAGLICAMVSTLLAFNYTQYNYVHEAPVMEVDDWIDTTEPPITYPEPKPIPPPPVSAKNDMIIEAVEDVPEPVFVEDVVKADFVIDPNATVVSDAPLIPAPLPPAPPLPEVELPDDIIIVAEIMPRMCTSCDTKDISRKEKNDCATKEMMTFVQKRLKYPSLAREMGISGMCPVRFIVNKDGSISDIELLRDIGAGCGKEAKRVVTMLQDQCWSPGRQNGRKVSVQMVLPIRFQLH